MPSSAPRMAVARARMRWRGHRHPWRAGRWGDAAWSSRYCRARKTEAVVAAVVVLICQASQKLPLALNMQTTGAMVIMTMMTTTKKNSVATTVICCFASAVFGSATGGRKPAKSEVKGKKGKRTGNTSSYEGWKTMDLVDAVNDVSLIRR